MNKMLTIGQLATLTGVSAKAIRYYEAEGVLPEPERSEARYRQYTLADVHRVACVRNARKVDVPIAELRGLFELSATGPRQQHLGALVDRTVTAMDQRIADLLRMKEGLATFETQLMTSQQASGVTDDQPLPHSPETCEACACLGLADSPVGFQAPATLVLQQSRMMTPTPSLPSRA